ncbi:helix-turn-helix transcriptional regulator [Acetobacterium wieringae]
MTIIVVIMTFIIVKTIMGSGGAIVGLKNRLKEYRARDNLNQSDLGKMVGTSRQTISLIERGDYSPSVILALRIAKVFGTTVEELFLYEEE